MDAKRSSGALARRRATSASTASGTATETAASAGGGWLTWSCASSTYCNDANGGRPASISKSMAPSAYWSVRAVISAAHHCSGAMYAGVPSGAPVAVSFIGSAPGSGVSTLAMPKSSTRIRGGRAAPSGPATRSRKTLSGLRSRWTTPAWCAAARASAISRVIRQASAGASRPRRWSAARSDSPSRSDITR